MRWRFNWVGAATEDDPAAPDRCAPRSRCARFRLDATGTQSRVVRRLGEHGPLRTVAAGGDDPAWPSAGTSRNDCSEIRQVGLRGGLNFPCARCQITSTWHSQQRTGALDLGAVGALLAYLLHSSPYRRYQFFQTLQRIVVLFE